MTSDATISPEGARGAARDGGEHWMAGAYSGGADAAVAKSYSLHWRCRMRPLHHGFTLLELLLVLALIVAFYSLAVPALKGPLAGQRLRKTADQVRTEWAKTRVRAMRSGQAHVFQFHLETYQYRVRPWLTAEDLVESSTATATGFSGEEQLAPSRKAREEVIEPPEGIVFVSIQIEDDRSLQMASDLAGLNEVDQAWSAPLFFYPDGTTSTARLVLANQYDDRIDVTLRGLTGIARYGEIHSAQDEEAVR